MREPVRDRSRLEHIQAAIERIQTNIKGVALDNLSANVLVYYGIVKNIEIIGEAAYNLTKAFRDKHPDTPWNALMGMRHVLVHDYYMISESQVRYVVEDNLAPLLEQVNRYLVEMNWDEWENNEQAKAESAVHKSLVQTARRMKRDGMSIQQISRYTGLTTKELEDI